jgi:alpha-maltose-1-phosphate synthase
MNRHSAINLQSAICNPQSHRRVLFVNSGILGHRAVAELLKDMAARSDRISADHINLSDPLTMSERVGRRVLSARIAPSSGRAANLDLARWRQELHAGLLAARRIAALARRGARYDVLHFHTQATAYASVARMMRTPAIVSIDATSRLASHEAASPLSRLTYQPNVEHDGAVFRAARAIISTSRWAARDLAHVYPDCADKTHVMPYPIKADGFDDGWVGERAARASAGAGGPVRVLFIGGDFPRKGGPLLLEAWRAADIADRAELDVVTDWPLDVARWPPGVKNIRGVTPYSSAWRELWRRADVFVMPSRHEAFGMVFQEAAVAGVPAIATRINAIPELVEDGVTGVLVEPDDVAGLVAAIRGLVDSADARARMGAAAQQRMRALASPDAYAAKLTALIEQVQERHVRRA